jgi:hypothetical protein
VSAEGCPSGYSYESHSEEEEEGTDGGVESEWDE